MQALIVSDVEARALPLQVSLTELGVDCPRSSILRVAEAIAALRAGKTFELVLLVCPENYSEAIRQVALFRQVTRTPLLVAGSTSQVNEILGLIRSGASDYLDLQGNVAADLTTIVRRLRTEHTGSEGRLTCVLSSSGGCGASTLAVNLAASLGTLEAPACLVDLNFRGGDLATLLNSRPRHTLVDLCCQGQRLDEAMFQQALVHHSPTLKLLAAPPLLTRFSGIDLDAVAHVLRLARTSFRHLLVDLEDTSHPEQAHAIRSCDQLLILLRLDFPCLLRARRIVDELRDDGVEANKIRLIVNRLGNPKSLSQKQAVEALGMPIFHSLPDDDSVMLTSVNVGNPAVLEVPTAKISKAYRKLAEMLAA
ncbi:CpaE family protein [Anatilimnocola sp. NA78]|uniref:AAA family ATPase n=1 Tax=Anatilimnocola sp. NA78 TaxID=3415683 RepID=UPI003CE4A92D